jgi:hypothetical protein
MRTKKPLQDRGVASINGDKVFGSAASSLII